MAKKNISEPAPAPAKKVTGKFYMVGKSDHLLYETFEIDVVDGVVTAVNRISRAPDTAQTAVGFASRAIWQNLRVQKSLDDETP